MAHANLGNEVCSLDNAGESPTSPCENCVDRTFVTLDSNQQVDEQQSLELSYVDEGSSTNPREDANNTQTDANANSRNNNNFEVSHDRENNGANSEKTISDAGNRNNQENNNNVPVSVPNVIQHSLK